jgi:hypothetical protein
VVTTLACVVSAYGCFSAFGHVEVPTASARSLILVKLKSGESPRVFAFEPADHGPAFVSFPRANGEDFDLVVFAYDCALDALGLVSGELAIAGTSAGKPIPRTVRPIESASVHGDRPIVFSATAPPPPDIDHLLLDAPKLVGACCSPALATATITVSLSPCQLDFCGPIVRKDLEACRFSIDLSPCAVSAIDGDFGVLGGSFDQSGAMHVDETPACHAIATTPYAAQSLACDQPRTCSIDFFLTPPPRFIVETATVIPNVPRIDPASDTVSNQEAYQGYLADLAVAGDRIVVSSFGGVANRDDQYACAVPTPSTLHFLDVETLQPIRTASAPPCLTRLLPSKPGSGFLGLSSSSSPDGTVWTYAIVTYDENGRTIARASHSIALDTVQRNYAYWAAGLVETVDVPPLYAALFGASFMMGDGRHGGHDLIHVLDPSSARIVETYDLFTIAGDHATCARSIVATPLPGRFAWVEDDLDLVRWIDNPVDALEVTGDPGEMTYHAAADRVLVPSGDRTRAMMSGGRGDRGTGLLERFFPREHDAAMLSTAVWPNDKSLAIVGGTSSVMRADGSWDRPAYVALFDPGSRDKMTSARFLPGMQRVGFGAIHRMVDDGRGRILLLLPWSGHLVRISAAR